MRLPGKIMVSTRLGRSIENGQDPDYAPDKRRDIQEVWGRKFPEAVERRPPTGQYNCHGLTFANRRTNIWEPSLIPIILADDGFRQIAIRDLVPGDLAVYFDGPYVSHSGIVLEVVQGVPQGTGIRAVRVLSKWGQIGEYIHFVGHDPYVRHQDRVSFYTDRERQNGRARS